MEATKKTEIRTDKFRNQTWITRSSVQYYEYPILELTKQNKDIFVNMECPQAPTAED